MAVQNKIKKMQLDEISDAIFEKHDKLVTIVVGDMDWFKNEKLQDNVTRLYEAILRREPDAQIFYVVSPGVKNNTDIENEVKFMMYMGSRKDSFTWDLKTTSNPKDVENLLKYWDFVSEPDFEPVESGIQPISANQFKEKVVEASKKQPIVVQLFEDGCFLCFLMRPMIQTINSSPIAERLGFKMVRFNIDANDFPEDLPMARGTPTFVLFKNGKGEKWAQFKPQDITKKMSDAFNHPDDLRKQIDELPGVVGQRLAMFTQMVMWSLEIKRLQKVLADPNTNLVPETKETDGFNEMVMALMAEDMKRTDKLEENVKYRFFFVDAV